MEDLSLPLLYEVFRFHPRLIQCLLCLTKKMYDRIHSHPDYIHTLFEEITGESDRSLDFFTSLQRCTRRRIEDLVRYFFDEAEVEVTA